jgi:hypothetical protein
MCGVTGFQGGVIFLAFSEGTRANDTRRRSARCRSTPAGQPPTGMRFPENSCKQPVQKCDSEPRHAPAGALATASDKPLLINQIIAFQADRGRAGHPRTYANMQHAALDPWKKNLAILSHCCFVWQYCNIEGGPITRKRRDLGMRPRRPAHPSSSAPFHVRPGSGIRRGKPVAMPERPNTSA